MKVCPTCGSEYAEYFRFCGVDGTALTEAEQQDPLVGRVIDRRYRLVSLIGRGAFGAVYKSRHERVPRDLAVKILFANRSTNPDFVARFEREVRAEAVLSHPHIVEVIDYGFASEVGYYIVMEHLAGEPLDERLSREGALKILDVYTIMTQAGSALALAHSKGIVHRDFKAENVFLVTANDQPVGYTVRLVDFGVVKITRPDGDLVGEGDALLETQAGASVGTPYTMSPEQIRAADVDGRADIYSLGVLLYEMLTGNVPFIGETLDELLEHHLRSRPTAPSEIDGCDWIPPELDALVLSMLAKDRAERPQTVEEVLDRLDQIRPAVEDAWAARHLVARPPAAARPLRVAEATPVMLNAPIEPASVGRPKGDFVATAEQVSAPPLGAGGPPPVPAAAAAPDAATRPRPRVLIVDDEAPIRRLVRRIINQRGYEAFLAETGEQALDWLSANAAPDAIILDLLLPGVDGLTLLKRMRDDGFAGPVIVCSGLASQALRDEAMRFGAVRFLAKVDDFHRISDVLDEMRVGC